MQTALPLGGRRLVWVPGRERPTVSWDFTVEVN